MKKYSLQYFIRKFSKLTDAEVGRHGLENHCALWHCGVRHRRGYYRRTPQAVALSKLLSGGVLKTDWAFHIWDINDRHAAPGGTPRGRILHALKVIQNHENTTT